MLKQYVGQQSFWNQGAVNDREKYYYGYGGYYGPGVSKNANDYRSLTRQPIKCDALTQDCWSKPRDTVCDGPNGCNFELFDGDASSPKFGVLGVVGIVAAAVLICKALK